MDRCLNYITAMILLISVAAAQSSQFGVSADNRYVTREVAPGQFERIFVIGAGLSHWAQTNGTNKMCSELEFTSAREIFNGLWYNITFDHSSPDFDWLHVNGHDAILIAGHNKISYDLRDRPSNRGITNTTEARCGTHMPRLDHVDQLAMYSKISNPANASIIDDLIFDLDERIGTRGDYIVTIYDEPERAFDNWMYYNNALEYILDRFRTTTSPDIHHGVSYLDLGPMDGNHYIRIHQADPYPNDDCAVDYEHAFHSSYSYQENLELTASYYKNSCEIMGFNSYKETHDDPALMGDAVTWVSNIADMPVWPWVPGYPGVFDEENNSYPWYDNGKLDVAYEYMRAQAYAAIAHGAGGVFFWTKRENTHSFWDVSLDVAKELQAFRYVYEKADENSENQSGDVRWKTVTLQPEISGNIPARFLFAVNTNSTSQQTITPWGFNITLEPNESGTWWRKNGSSAVKLNSPLNLGFENTVTQSGWHANWTLATAPSNEDVSIHAGTAGSGKIGIQNLKIFDHSPVNRASAYQYFDVVPGVEYMAQAWFKNVAFSTEPQRISLQFYDGGQFIQEEIEYATAGTEWSLVKTTPMMAPANATRAKILIFSNYADEESRGVWDDVMPKIVGFPGITPVSATQADSNTRNSHGLASTAAEVSLEEAAPNPFNATTVIRFNVPERQFVQLTLHDMLGREVSTIASGFFDSGSHSITLDANALASGMYVYRLSTGGRSISKTLSLIK